MGRVFRFAALAVAAAAAVFVAMRMRPPASLADFRGADVRRGEDGAVVIRAKTWDDALQAQGYAAAASRWAELDELRRAGGGLRAAVAGAAAFASDARAQREDRIGAAARAAADLAWRERALCDAYAGGVNAFLAAEKSAERWACSDVLLVELERASLAATAPRDLARGAWAAALPEAWRTLLIARAYPGNKPVWGRGDERLAGLPHARDWLPKKALGADEEKSAQQASAGVLGASTGGSWQYALKLGADALRRGAAAVSSGTFLAAPPADAWARGGTTVSSGEAWGRGAAAVSSGPNGTFLAAQPAADAWIAFTFMVGDEPPVKGFSPLGAPGLTIGQNSLFAFALTASGEDIDDVATEHLSADRGHYLEARRGAEEQWSPVTRKTFVVAVKGEAPREVIGAFTRRGPLDDDGRSRQWRALQPGGLGVPGVAFIGAKSLAEFAENLAHGGAPARVAVAVTGGGEMLMRAVGPATPRPLDGALAADAIAGEWPAADASGHERVQFLRADKLTAHALVAAGQRLWVDPLQSDWQTDERAEGLRAASDAQSLRVALNGGDTHFAARLLKWVAANAAAGDAHAAALRRWGGEELSAADVRGAQDAARALWQVLVGRVRMAYPAVGSGDPAGGDGGRSALLAVLSAPGDAGLTPFGLEAGEVAGMLLRVATAERKETPAAGPQIIYELGTAPTKVSER